LLHEEKIYPATVPDIIVILSAYGLFPLVLPEESPVFKVYKFVYIDVVVHLKGRSDS